MIWSRSEISELFLGEVCELFRHLWFFSSAVKVTLSRSGQRCNLFPKPQYLMFWIFFLLCEPIVSIFFPWLRLGEVDEEVREGALLQEAVHCRLWLQVAGITHHFPVQGQVLEVVNVSGILISERDHFKKFKEFFLLSRRRQALESTGQLILAKALDRLLNSHAFRVLPVAFTLVKVRLVGEFDVLQHCAENGATVNEGIVLAVFLVSGFRASLFLGFLWHGWCLWLGDAVCLWSLGHFLLLNRWFTWRLLCLDYIPCGFSLFFTAILLKDYFRRGFFGWRIWRGIDDPLTDD